LETQQALDKVGGGVKSASECGHEAYHSGTAFARAWAEPSATAAAFAPSDPLCAQCSSNIGAQPGEGPEPRPRDDATPASGQATGSEIGSRSYNPDFVAIVVHSYRHRYGLAPGAGDPRYDEIEMGLAAQPRIAVPAITIDGDADGVNPGAAPQAKRFTGPHEHRVFKGAGHNLPQERPEDWARAMIDLDFRSFRAGQTIFLPEANCEASVSRPAGTARPARSRQPAP
jgi:pimeloyl-ACP methyl ester carboxylesterase